MLQSCVEIEGYSVAHFNWIVAFEVPYRWIFVKGWAHMHFVDSLDIHASMKCVWAPPLMEVQRYGLRPQWCDWNTWQKNFRFLHGTATYVISTSIFVENNIAHGNTSVKSTRVFYMKTATHKEDKKRCLRNNFSLCNTGLVSAQNLLSTTCLGLCDSN